MGVRVEISCQAIINKRNRIPDEANQNNIYKRSLPQPEIPKYIAFYNKIVQLQKVNPKYRVYLKMQ